MFTSTNETPSKTDIAGTAFNALTTSNADAIRFNALTAAVETAFPDSEKNAFDLVMTAIRDTDLFEKVEKGVYRLTADALASFTPASSKTRKARTASFPKTMDGFFAAVEDAVEELTAPPATFTAIPDEFFTPAARRRSQVDTLTWAERVFNAVQTLDPRNVYGVRPMEAEAYLRAVYGREITTTNFDALVRALIQDETKFLRVDRGLYIHGRDSRVYARANRVVYTGAINYGGGRSGIRRNYRTPDGVPTPRAVEAAKRGRKTGFAQVADTFLTARW